MKGMWILLVAALLLAGCEKEKEPELSGEFLLSSQRFGTESYYLLGFRYHDSQQYRFPNLGGGAVPDIINEAFLVISGDDLIAVPGFNTPGRINGFSLAGAFDSKEEAAEFYRTYTEVPGDAQFNILSDTVRENQVWIQKTAAGNYAKLLVTDVRFFETENVRINSEVTIEYTYQPDGTNSFGN